ncbi:MAG TPA: H-NS family nucleoid-associated regulatory protein [Pseudolabrys sp.]|nr:H-NS family nucleoid-associated regulatory protein [Pseudolabrys sp.]
MPKVHGALIPGFSQSTRIPAEPSETWSGRGKQPRWLVSALKADVTVEDFRIRRHPRSS